MNASSNNCVVCITNLVVDDDVVFSRHVIGDVMVDDQTQKSVEQRQIDLLVQFFESRLQQYIALALTNFPYVLQIVDACGKKSHVVCNCYSN